MGLTAQQIGKLAGHVWPPQGAATFALLDGAGIPALLDKLYGTAELEFECLYSGELEPDVAEVAPYIVRLEAGTEFAAWVLAGWGEQRGIFAHVARGRRHAGAAPAFPQAEHGVRAGRQPAAVSLSTTRA